MEKKLWRQRTKHEMPRSWRIFKKSKTRLEKHLAVKMKFMSGEAGFETL